MLCYKKNTELCGCLSFCIDCDLENTPNNDYIENLNYKIRPIINLQNYSCFKCKPSLLKNRVYEVKNGYMINEFKEKIYLGNQKEFYKEYKDWIEIIL